MAHDLVTTGMMANIPQHTAVMLVGIQMARVL
jgi:hypothetical protein